jgi:hypothetical protein
VSEELCRQSDLLHHLEQSSAQMHQDAHLAREVREKDASGVEGLAAVTTLLRRDLQELSRVVHVLARHQMLLLSWHVEQGSRPTACSPGAFRAALDANRPPESECCGPQQPSDALALARNATRQSAERTGCEGWENEGGSTR